MLLKGANLISDGSELLLEVMDPGLIGGLLLPILGALPDAAMIVVSGTGGSAAEAQDEVGGREGGGKAGKERWEDRGREGGREGGRKGGRMCSCVCISALCFGLA